MSNQPAYKCIVVTLHKNDHVAHGVDISSTGVSANLAGPVPGLHYSCKRLQREYQWEIDHRDQKQPARRLA
jgi:hypothetical protein